jgi:hypothetical protein
MLDVNGLFQTAILVFMIVCFLALLGQLVCYVLEQLYKAVVYILGSLFGRDRDYDLFFKSFFENAIYISLICCVTYFFWNFVIKPLYDCIGLLLS